MLFDNAVSNVSEQVVAMPNISNPDISAAIIVAHDDKLGIGKKNDLPWRIKGDLKFFRQITTQLSEQNANATEKQNVVIMGRKTWESLPSTYKPLPNRINLVLTRDSNYVLPNNVKRSTSLEEALQIVDDPLAGRIFVIGGATIYREAIKLKVFSTLYVTEIAGNFDCDAFFPEYKEIFNMVSSSEIIAEDIYRYCHKTYKRQL